MAAECALDDQAYALTLTLEATPRVLIHCSHPKAVLQRFMLRDELMRFQIPHHTASARTLVGEWRTLYTETPTAKNPEPERAWVWCAGCIHHADYLFLLDLEEFSTTVIEKLTFALRTPDIEPINLGQLKIISPHARKEWQHRPTYIIAAPGPFQTESSRKRLAEFSRLLGLVDCRL